MARFEVPDGWMAQAYRFALDATVAQDSSGRWFCSLQTVVMSKARPTHAPWSAHPVVGVDAGVKDLLVVAAPDGTEAWRVTAPRSLTAAQPRLRRLQRKAARQHGTYDADTRTKRKPSKRWRKTQALIGKIHVRAANVRRDVLHKATTALAQRHHVVVVETLNVAGMRTAGDVRKRGLTRALADAALADIRRMLTYKTRWYGSYLVQADQFFPSSKTCSVCGGRKPSLSLADRTYACERCGVVIDRDLNAAINLARLGETCKVGERSPADSGSVAGRGAIRETEPARAGEAGGSEASTPRNPDRVGQTGTAVSKGTAA